MDVAGGIKPWTAGRSQTRPRMDAGAELAGTRANLNSQPSAWAGMPGRELSEARRCLLCIQAQA